MKDSVQLQERFSQLQVRAELLDSVFGPERSDALQGELNTAVRSRELLHAQLLQRRSRLKVRGATSNTARPPFSSMGVKSVHCPNKCRCSLLFRVCRHINDNVMLDCYYIR